jgi:hypothetical protein
MRQIMWWVIRRERDVSAALVVIGLSLCGGYSAVKAIVTFATLLTR